MGDVIDRQEKLKEERLEARLSLERRDKLRVEGPYPAIVRGSDESGRRFEADTFVDNLSAGGLFLRLSEKVHKGTQLFILCQLSTSLEDGLPPPRVAIRGRVVRLVPQADGSTGLGIAISNHRFL